MSTMGMVVAVVSMVVLVEGVGNHVIYAVNCGGDEHTDIHGIRYEKDPLKVGIASDYGKIMYIRGAAEADQILYQTERYHTADFGYDIPIPFDGNFVLVLKFAEVVHHRAGMKTFDVVLNGDHVVVRDLDVFRNVGHATAYDVLVEFVVARERFFVNGEESDIVTKNTRVEFVKGNRENPKINAMYVMVGEVKDVPVTDYGSSLVQDGDWVDESGDLEADEDGWEADEEDEGQDRGYFWYPFFVVDAVFAVFILVACFLPLVWYLCRL